MFHIGHLNILKNAKKNCDYLIVGVSTDELVNQYKARSPIIKFNDRKKIIENIKAVDEEVAQTHRNKIKSFHEIGFDIMFVGDDWKGDPLFKELENELNKHGAKLLYFPYTKNISSTKLSTIIEKIYIEDECL